MSKKRRELDGIWKEWSSKRRRLKNEKPSTRNPFIPRTPSRLVAPIDLVLIQFWFFAYLFCVFSSCVTRRAARMLIEFRSRRYERIYIFTFHFETKNSFVANFFFAFSRFSIFFSFFFFSKWKKLISILVYRGSARKRYTHHHHHHHHHVLTVGVVTWALIDNVTSGASHLTCLRGGRERYYEATSTKPLHWQAS